MDYLILIKRCGALVLITAMLFSCSDRQSLFAHLVPINIGPEFPRWKKDVTECRIIEYEPCLDVYQAAKVAKQSLFSKSREQALDSTLEALSEECAEQEPNMDERLTCMGAITALYFFPTRRDDDAIRGFLEHSRHSVLGKVIGEHGDWWLLNREDKPAWREWAARSRLSVDDSGLLMMYLKMQPYVDLTINHLDNPI